ncbi:lysophospholipid acyltransferase family protein [Melioribacter sp. OK-6-Me]|uniref:lysophospholipid acyltransferase family protein n=1 Tax=unclassified Melioribacter TaxID=2627329 RepID=UPI003EDA1EC6
MPDKNKIEYFLFRSLVAVFNKIGLNRTRKLARIIGFLFYYLIPIRKSTVLKNLRKAFPEKSKKEIHKIARQNYVHMSITFSELMILPSLEDTEIKNEIIFENKAHIEEIINNEKGTILLTGHFGNWEVIMSALAVNIPAVYNVLVKPQRNIYITKWLESTRKRGNIRVIPSGVTVKQIFSALKNGEVVGIAGDQRGPADAFRFSFFDVPTALNTGAAAFALKTGSDILLLVAVRQHDFKYKIYTSKLELDLVQGEYNEKLIYITQNYISFLESYIRKYPSQYFWMHKIWKY